METENKYIIIDADIVADVARNPHIEDEEYVNFQYYSDGKYPRKLIDEVRPNEHLIVIKKLKISNKLDTVSIFFLI